MTIFGYTVAEQQRQVIISNFREHPKFEFMLTGSRYFGNSRRDSDIDFFAQLSTDIITYLEQLGFDQIESQYHTHYVKDPEIAYVFRYEFANIDVQLVINFLFKRQAQTYIKGDVLMKMRIKNPFMFNRRRVWLDAYEHIRNGKGEA